MSMSKLINAVATGLSSPREHTLAHVFWRQAMFVGYLGKALVFVAIEVQNLLRRHAQLIGQGQDEGEPVRILHLFL